MSTLIAVAGKGGVGKTTVAALAVARLIARGCEPVLAVDADPNRCLDGALGVEVTATVGGVREEARALAGQGLAAGMSKQDLLELKIAEGLVEADCFDLIAMGRPEGPGCYCYANNVLKQTLGQLAGQYPYVVLDNEAGLENLSRRLVRRVDVLLMVTDPSRRGVETLGRLHDLAREMEIEYGCLGFVVNRVRRGGVPEAVRALASEREADCVVALPDDEVVADYGEEGRCLLELPSAHPLCAGVDELLSTLGL